MFWGELLAKGRRIAFQRPSHAAPQFKRDACLRTLRELEKLATVAGDDVVILFGQAWDNILQTGRLSGRIDLDWFLSQRFNIDSLSNGHQGLPNDHPFILSHPRSGHPTSYYQATSETSYNGDLTVRLQFGGKSIIAAVMPHAQLQLQSVGAGMNRYTDPIRASLLHRALDGQLLNDFSEFKHSTSAAAGLVEKTCTVGRGPGAGQSSCSSVLTAARQPRRSEAKVRSRMGL